MLVTGVKRFSFSILGMFVAASNLRAQEPSELGNQAIRVFAESCASCHNANNAQGKLRLDSLEALAAGGASGPAVVAGNAAGSKLYVRITSHDRAMRMPPAGAPLDAAKVETIRMWIERGTPGMPQSAAANVHPVDFKQQVEPIFRSSCYECHSGTRARSNLRLDSKKGATKGGMGGAVIVPGDSGASRLLARVKGRSGEARMPLGKQPLSSEQIAILKHWIDSGANWPTDARETSQASNEKHWAYVKPVRPAVPRVESPVRNPIDNFILAGLSKKGISFSPEASKEKLIRRVSLDLTGLPPTPAETRDFVADTRPDAYERLVARLLASPHYGERWARPWLDYARYADTNGYEADMRRTMWKYRDWVINALNADMPFDEFTIEQIAGDLLPNATPEQRIATGFQRNTMFNEEGGVDKDETFFEVLVDRVNTAATVWLGSTIACSQCHNHKYDPFSQKEYYQLMAFFSNGKKEVHGQGSSERYREPVLELPTPDQERERSTIKARIDALEGQMKENTSALLKEQKKWETKVLSANRDWKTLTAAKVDAAAGTTIRSEKDGSYIAAGENPQDQTYSIECVAPIRKLSGLRLEALPHPSLPRSGPGRDIYGNFVLTELTAEIDAGDGWREIVFDKVLADDGRVKPKNKNQLWVIDASREDQRLGRQLLLLPKSEIKLSKNARLRVRMRMDSPLLGQSIGRFRLSVTDSREPARVVDIQAKLRPVLQRPSDQRSDEESKKLADYYQTVSPSLKHTQEELKRLKEELDDLHITTALVLEEKDGTTRAFDFVRARGSFASKEEKAYANVPAVLGSLSSSEPANRLTFAKWLVSWDNPLTARVTVNRIWEQYFGHGLVETSEDFGTQGEAPVNPQLLDWLAVEFMDRGWSMKTIHRLIVTSTAYRQSPTVTPEILRIDPNNRLISRGPRFRLDAETIRDLSLATSGLLSHKIGGPSVFPPQPPGVWDLPYNDDTWKESTGEDKYRRGIYTFIRRSATYPAMVNFDAPSREFCTIRRIRTNTPLQALTTLNDAAFFEAAQALGARMLREGGSTERSKIDFGFQLAVGRAAKPSERDRIQSWLHKEQQYFTAHHDYAAKIAPRQPEPQEVAPWVMLANVLLNMDETLTKD